MNILKEGVRSACVRIIRILVYLLLFIVVSYILGLITTKRAKALTYQGFNVGYLKDPGNARSGSFGTGHNTFSFDFEYNNIQAPTSDLIGFRLHALEVAPFSTQTEYTYDDCTGNYGGGVQGDYHISWTCVNQTNGSNDFYSYTDWNITTYAFVYYEDNSSQFCWLDSSVENTFLCPTSKTKGIKKVQLYLDIYSPLLSGGYYIVTSNNYALYNYDNTSMVQEQQQTNQTLTDSSTTGSQSNGTTALNGIQNTMQSKLKGTNELTQMVLSPITILSTIASNSCQPITWNIPLVNYQATIPCMSTIYNQYFSGLISLFSTIITGIFAYRTVIKLVSTLKDCLDAENDKIEVIDL